MRSDDILIGQLRLEPVIGQWKGKVELKVLERGREREKERDRERKKEEGEDDGADVTWSGEAASSYGFHFIV